jgi:glucosamine--fructose-6-phosphate aminotransferase (isomerizing)
MDGKLMASEMAEQPERLAALIKARDRVACEVAPLFAGAQGTVVVARGSSDHAATTGRYLLEMATGRPVASASPSVYTLYGAEVDFGGYVVIGVSQSGRTPEISTVLAMASARGARTVALTNDTDSPLASSAEVVVQLMAGEEQAVPATKTVTAELVAFAMIASSISGDPGKRAWERLPAQAAAVLADDGPPTVLAEWLAETDLLTTMARGLLSGAAAETALKLQETSSILAAAFPAADLRHGPIALASRGIGVLAFAHPGPALSDVTSLAGELTSRGADVRLIGPVPGSVFGWAADAPEMFAPVLAVVRGQQLALRTALRLGFDPDRPAGLTKVTAT